MEAGKSDLALRAVVGALEEEGFYAQAAASDAELEQSGKIERVKVHATGVVQNPHDPDAQ